MNAPAEKLVEDMKTLAADVRAIVALTADQTSDKIAEARDNARDALARVENTIASAQAAAARRARKTAHAAADYAHDHPAQVALGTLAAALALGALVAYVARRR